MDVFDLLGDHNVKFCRRVTVQTQASKVVKSRHSSFLFFFFLQRLLNMHVYDNAMYANLEDLNA